MNEGKTNQIETLRELNEGKGNRLKRIALIAHDSRKVQMREWVSWNRDFLTHHQLFATGTTGAMIAEELSFPVHLFKSGPMGGDQQVGAAVAEGRIDFIIFFWDPLQTHPHDVDVKALIRIAAVYNIPMACNRASADYMISSPLMHEEPAATADEPVRNGLAAV